MTHSCQLYWDEVALQYQRITRISQTDFHFGPLLPGERTLQLLPELLRGQRALEVGCGAGQNSLYLASRGVDCCALDVSIEQLKHGWGLAEKCHHPIRWLHGAMDALPVQDGRFDLVHSTYALPFATDPQHAISEMARVLKVGGTLVLTTGHPLFAAEWLDIDDEGCGMFVRNYFQPPPDIRFCEDRDEFIASRVYPVSDIVNWVVEAGLQVRQLCEPEPLPIPTMSEAEIAAQVPYDSADWRELYSLAAAIPLVLIVTAEKA